MSVLRVNQKVAVSAVYVAAMFMNIMDATIVNVALPTLGRQFGVAPDAVDTVAIGYLVSLAVFIPVSGWLGDRLGERRVLLGAIALFTVASGLCGQAHSLGELVAFRVLQGVAGGLMTPVGMAMLFRTFPPSERVRASSILTVPTAFAPAIGPVLGGLLVTDASWRWVFYVNVPIGLAALTFGALCLAEQPRTGAGRLDVTGFVLSGIGFGALMYGVSEGPIKGWSSIDVLVSLAVGLALIAAMVRLELRRPEPLLDLRLFHDRLFRTASLVTLLSGIGFLGILFTLALFYQDGLGLSALGSGLSTFPEAIGVMLTVQVVTRRLYARVGPGPLMAAGLVWVTVAVSLMTLVGAGTNLWWMRALVFCMGAGMACVFVPSQAVAFATVPKASTGNASTLYNAIRQIGGAAGVGLLTTVVAAVGPFRRVNGHLTPHLVAYHRAFLAAAVFALVAAGVGLTVGRRDPTAAPAPAEADRAEPVVAEAG